MRNYEVDYDHTEECSHLERLVVTLLRVFLIRTCPPGYCLSVEDNILNSIKSGLGDQINRGFARLRLPISAQHTVLMLSFWCLVFTHR